MIKENKETNWKQSSRNLKMSIYVHWTDTKCGLRLALFFMSHLASLWYLLDSCVSGPLLRYDFKGGGMKFFTLYTNCSWMHKGMSGEKCFLHIFIVRAYFRANLISIFFSPKCPLCKLESVRYSNINFSFIHIPTYIYWLLNLEVLKMFRHFCNLPNLEHFNKLLKKYDTFHAGP